jgi:hypothetical protein
LNEWKSCPGFGDGFRTQLDPGELFEPALKPCQECPKPATKIKNVAMRAGMPYDEVEVQVVPLRIRVADLPRVGFVPV